MRAERIAKGRFKVIRSKVTGERGVIDTYRNRYKRLCLALSNVFRLEKYFVKHITLTQTVEQYHPRILNNFWCNMRHYFGELVYLWSVEVQEERAAGTGSEFSDSNMVLHWHAIVGFPWCMNWKENGREYLAKIVSFWKYGNVDIVPCPDRPRIEYLMKYVTKALDAPVDVEYQIRRVGSSLLGGWLRQTWKKLSAAIDRIGMEVRNFWWDHRGAYAWDEWNVGGYSGRDKVYVYRHPPSDWEVVYSCDEYPANLNDNWHPVFGLKV